MIKAFPNILSTLRILLVPFILYLIIQNYFFLAFILSGVASISDMLDGFLARKSRFGGSFGGKMELIVGRSFLGLLVGPF